MFHAGHPLLEFDRRLVLEVAESLQSNKLPSVPVALDLGCGTGRVMMPLVESGWRVLGIDLSQSMLSEVQSKFSSGAAGQLGLVRGNLAQLGCLQDASVDLAYCLYSSIGMVQGRAHRQAMLRDIARCLQRTGEFIVHVHNRGTWWSDPGGVRRGVGDWNRSLRDKNWEFGDRVYAYRGLPSMYLHIFSQRELRVDLRQAGLEVCRWIRLNRTSSGELAMGWWMPYFRAGGFIAVARKSQ